MAAVLDRATLKRALENNDAAMWKGFYTDDAEVRVIDQDHPPSHPLVLKGSKAIGDMFDDVCGRALKHHLEESVTEGDHMAFAETCTYPDGVKVYMNAIMELRNGKVRRQTNIQAWDH